MDDDSRTLCGNNNTLLRSIIIFCIVQYFFAKVSEIIPRIICRHIANFIISTFIVQKWYSFEYKKKIFPTAYTNESN